MRTPLVKPSSSHPFRRESSVDLAVRVLQRTARWIGVMSLAGVSLALQSQPVAVPASGSAAAVGVAQITLSPCAPGGAVQTLAATACWPTNCTDKIPALWNGVPLSVPKFDPALGRLIGVRVDLEVEYEVQLCVDNQNGGCCVFDFDMIGSFSLVQGFNQPPLGVPQPASLDVQFSIQGIVLGPDDGWADCFQGGVGPPADGTCIGGDAFDLSQAGAEAKPSIWIVDPIELPKWIAGLGNPTIEFLSDADALSIITTNCNYSSLWNLDSVMRLTVTYEYCAPSVGLVYCSGDGSGTACPCGNAGAAGVGCANSSGGGGSLLASGSADVFADDLQFGAGGLLPGRPGLLLAGLNAVNGGLGIAFGDGLRCAGGALARLGVRTPDALGAALWGPGLAGAGGWSPGDVRRFQVWYRDVAGSPCGSAFNLTNGVEVAFY